MMLKLLRFFGSLRITVIGLVLLLILTVWGTLYQADYGLYLAQERFYQSWYFLVGGFFPFPGAQLVMTVMFVNLATSMIVVALRSRLRWGLITTHLGLLMMLAAGAVTFYLGRHSQLTLTEGEGANVAISFDAWEMVVMPPSTTGNRKISAIDLPLLKPGRQISLPGGKLAIRVEEYYRNAEGLKESVDDLPENASGWTSLRALPPGKEPSDDRPGVVFMLLEDGQEKGRYLLWGGDPGATMLRAGDELLMVGIRRARLPLPAVIQLVDFRRELHPGSGIAKSFSSQVIVKSGQDEADRKVLISMNKPLRLQGFTFYQSSFSSAPGGLEVSTFSVVKNYGRLMPYIATGVTVVGMLLHFTGMLIIRLKRRELAEAAS